MVRLNRAWDKAVVFTKNKKYPNNHVKGIMTNIICILLNLGWQPKLFNEWIDHSGNTWKLDMSVAPLVVAKALIHKHISMEMFRASTHYDGKGLEFGVEWHITLSKLRSLRKKNYVASCALESIMSACNWPQARIHQADPN